MMDLSKQGLSLDVIRELDMVDYLETLGFQPAKPSRNGIDFYYLSPLRAEDDPSFHVNRKKNQWYDHGVGRGGNTVDFGLAYFNCTVRELLDRFSTDFSFHRHIDLPVVAADGLAEKESKIIITGERPIWSYPLKNYLHERHIPVSVAEQRDTKGLYRKARAGQLKNFTGIDSPYEAPENPEIHIRTESMNAETAALHVLGVMRDRGLLESFESVGSIQRKGYEHSL